MADDAALIRPTDLWFQVGNPAVTADRKIAVILLEAMLSAADALQPAN
jgi:hypothetical protein